MRQRILPGSGRTGTAAYIAAVLGALLIGAVPAAALRRLHVPNVRCWRSR